MSIVVRWDGVQESKSLYPCCLQWQMWKNWHSGPESHVPGADSGCLRGRGENYKVPNCMRWRTNAQKGHARSLLIMFSPNDSLFSKKKVLKGSNLCLIPNSSKSYVLERWPTIPKHQYSLSWELGNFLTSWGFLRMFKADWVVMCGQWHIISYGPIYQTSILTPYS